jgi:hypothetical protein
MAPLNEARVPFSSTHGVRHRDMVSLVTDRLLLNFIYFILQNHDNQKNITHLKEIRREQQVSPLSYTRAAPPGVGGEGGEGNYWVPVSQAPSQGIQRGADPTCIFARSMKRRAVRVRPQMRDSCN